MSVDCTEKVQFCFNICTFAVQFCVSLRQSRLDTFARCKKYSTDERSKRKAKFTYAMPGKEEENFS